MPKISIIIPIYNVEKYLQKCINSIIAQTEKDFECILVNDCSPDNCEQICKNVCKQDSRFVYVKREKNGGLGAARNSGLDVATGKYISFIDSDDTLAPNFYEELLPYAEKYGWVRSGLRIVNENNRELRRYTVGEALCKKTDEELKILNNKYNFDLSTVCPCIFKAEVIGDLRFDTCQYGEDYIFSLTLFNSYGQVYFRNIYLYNYLSRQDSLSGSKTVNKFRLITFLNSFTKMLRQVSDEKLKNHYIKNFENRNLLKDLCHNGIDFVMPYVNNNDPIWQDSFKKYNKNVDIKNQEVAGESRYRENGFLKYLFRSIEKNMPWINKIHLIVSSESQIPEWIDKNKIHIVLHEDIIPKELLPTFNSSTIEMFYHNIVGLSDRFIYGNDDIFLIKPSKETDFFNGNNPKIEMLKITNISGKEVWRKTNINSYKLATGKTDLKDFYTAPEHGLTPYTKEVVQIFKSKFYKQMYESCTQFRDPKNLNIYMYADYLYYKGLVDKHTLKFKFIGNGTPVSEIQKCFNIADHICINDTETKQNERAILEITSSFEKLFGEKCIYEIGGNRDIKKFPELYKLPTKQLTSKPRDISEFPKQSNMLKIVENTKKNKKSAYGQDDTFLYF